MATAPAAQVRQTIKVSEKTAKLLRMLSALDGASQVEIADSAISEYVASRKSALKGRLSEVQALIDKGQGSQISQTWAKRAVAKRSR